MKSHNLHPTIDTALLNAGRHEVGHAMLIELSLPRRRRVDRAGLT